MYCLLTNLIANPYTSHAVDRVCDSLIGDEHVFILLSVNCFSNSEQVG